MKKHLILNSLMVLIVSILLTGCKKEEMPVANFIVTYIPDYSVASFENRSVDADHYEWDMGNDTIIKEFEPNGGEWYRYSKPGKYLVTLTAYSASETMKSQQSFTISIY
jgi:PKD repeat protein